MARDDLIALTEDDLAALANRGLLKRALRELESDDLTFTVEEDADGTVQVDWSDGNTCQLPGGVTPGDGRCTCPATSLCRHLIRSVLAYQRRCQLDADAGPGSRPGGGSPRAGRRPWDPGTIDDEQLAAHHTRALRNRMERQLEGGIIAELVRSAKPLARFFDLGATVRFLVEGDLRYATCDCPEADPCRHALLAVWAFRRLSPGEDAGYVSTYPPRPPEPKLVEKIEGALCELIDQGIDRTRAPDVDRLRGLRASCERDGLIWPADVLDELINQLVRHAGQDARFDPLRVTSLVGELVNRLDALGNDTGAVPAPLIRGLESDRAARLGRARLIGLGCEARRRRGSTILLAYLQDSRSGSVVTISRQRDDPDEGPPSFSALARRPLRQGLPSFHALGSGQLLAEGARRSPTGDLKPGRRASHAPQDLGLWPQLRPPLLADGFEEVSSRLGALPPRSLRPRRASEDLHVCPVASVEDVIFDVEHQEVRAGVVDEAGQRALLRHAYTTQGAEGCEALLSHLSRSESVRYICGRVRRRSEGLIIAPISVIVADERGALMMAQPWVDQLPIVAQGGPAGLTRQRLEPTLDPITSALTELKEALAEVMVLGAHNSRRQADDLRRVARRLEAQGFDRLPEAVARLSGAISSSSSSPSSSPDGGPLMLTLLSLLAIADEL